MRRHVVLSAAVAMLAACGGGEATPGGSEPSPSQPALACRPVTTTVDHDDTARETRTPQAQASSFPGRRTVTFESDERVDIAVADPAGRVTAVLTYHNDGDLGWRLREIFSCP